MEEEEETRVFSNNLTSSGSARLAQEETEGARCGAALVTGVTGATSPDTSPGSVQRLPGTAGTDM